MTIEDLAFKAYSQAAVYFADNQILAEFLAHSAKDEAWHYNVMASAAEHDHKNPLPAPPISISSDIKNKTVEIFNSVNEKIINRTLTEKFMLEALVSSEFSEWNDLFLYVVNSLKGETEEFKYAAATIQNHLRFIENFIENTEYAPELKKQINSLSPVWTENILIVDDEDVISELLSAILSREGNIDIAKNGQEGLIKLSEKYYKLIICDVDMPVMDGLTFYNRATELYPKTNDKFLFMTGDPSKDRIDFFKRNQLKYLYKPVPISIVRNESLSILMQSIQQQVY